MVIVVVPILLIIVGIPTVLIVLDALVARKAEDEVGSKTRRLIEATRSWQTLVGALVGFLAAACMLILDSNLKSHEEQRKQREQELSLLRSVALDANASRESLIALAGLPRSPEENALRCMNLLHIYQTHPVGGIKVARRLDQIAGSVSLEVYASINDLNFVLDLYASTIRNVGQNDCASDPKLWIGFLHNASRDASDELTRLMQQNQGLITKVNLPN